MVDFSRYRRNLRAATEMVMHLMVSVGVYLVSFLMLYMLTVVPARRLSYRKKIEAILKGRYKFGRVSLALLQKNRAKWDEYYRRFIEPDFSKVWDKLILLLGSMLPPEMWVNEIIWKREDLDKYVMVIKGEGITKQGFSAEDMVYTTFSPKKWKAALLGLVDGVTIWPIKMEERGRFSYVVEIHSRAVSVG